MTIFRYKLQSSEAGMLQQPVEIRSQKWPAGVDPLASICCTVFAHEDFIRDAMEGFLMQKTTFRVEILIHDDASPDQSAEIITTYESKYPELIRTVYQRDNQYSRGFDPAVKFLFPKVQGSYIALCEGDDYWTDPFKLQKQIEFLEENSGFSVCVGGYTRLYENTRHMKTVITERDGRAGFEFTLQDMQHEWLTKTLTAVFRTSQLKKTDLSIYNYGRDIHLFYHLIKDQKAFYFSENFGVYRIHNGGVNSTNQGKVNKKAAYNCYRELYLRNKDEFTRIMYLKNTLSLLNFNLFNRYKGNSLLSNLHLFVEAVLLIRAIPEVKMLVMVVYSREWKDKVRNLLKKKL